MIQIASASPFIQSLEHILGFLVVLVVLTFLWTLTALIGRFFISREAARPARVVPRAAAADDGPTDEEVAAVTAAIMAVMGSRSRVVSIRPSSGKDWSREGRREHFASHKIR
jgi:sodium pump decarboxylase gamma subunit